jgi:hypothetical protein
MPTDDERREYPRMTEAERARLQEFLAREAERAEYDRLHPPEPTWQDLILALLREQTELLREIRDKLR